VLEEMSLLLKIAIIVAMMAAFVLGTWIGFKAGQKC